MANSLGADTAEDGFIRRALHRLGSSDAQLEAQDLQESSRFSGATTICDCHQGDVVTVCGPLRSVTLRPAEGLPTLEAEIYDGSGRVTLVWLGRRRIVGIDPGRVIVATGRVAEIDGRSVMFNPQYALQPRAVAG